MLFEMTTAEAEAAEWALFVAEATVEDDPSRVSTRDLVTRVQGLRGRLSAQLSGDEARMCSMDKKPTGVADAAAHAADIGCAIQMIEGFEPVKLPQWEMVSKDQDGTPIYRDNWGAYDAWIPVEQRLPEENQPVLVWMPDLPHAEHGMDIGYYMKSSWGVDWMVSGGRSAFPSHWMPLPKPPSLAAPDLTPDTVAALREDWESLHKGPRQHVEIVTLPELPEVK